MSKPFSEDDLAEQLTRDLTWRIREISDLKAAVRSGDRFAQPALLRALITIAYAHWEGHIRFSAKRYLTHVALRKFPFSSLQPQFVRNSFLPRLASISGKGIEERGLLVDAILDSGTDRFASVNDSLINTRANLSFEVLVDICLVCGIDHGQFENFANFIDIILLKRRNSIAHGEDTLVSIAELDDVAEQTITVMRTFSNDLQTKAYLKEYRLVQ